MAALVSFERKLTPFQIIILGFAGVILAGGLLLMLPVSSRSGEFTSFSDSLFTSVSAVCVTGLVVQDTATHWSPFGQAVILLLIQIGGLGVVTTAAVFSLLAGKKLSLKQRYTMQEAISAPKVGGIAGFTKFLVGITLLTELLGALLMMPVFCRDHGIRGIWLAVFHSISAFCNAGFDLMGTPGNLTPSLTGYSGNVLINLVIMGLIISGGLGFLTWEDIRTNGFRLRRYRAQSKIVLSVTAALILIPAALFFLTEYSFLPPGQRLLGCLFQSVTARTAGFNTCDLNAMSGAGQAVMIGLMLIGGSPGSTAGGMKTTTFAVLLANARASLLNRNEVRLFRRSIHGDIVRNASAILSLYIFLFLGGALIISLTEALPLGSCLYETASALGTVGLSLGITGSLGLLSRAVLMILMFLGRVGSLTFAYAAFAGTAPAVSKLPAAPVAVG